MYSEWETEVNSRLETLLKTEVSESSNGRFFEALGREFAALERNPDAIWSYEKALALAPWNMSARSELQAVQTKLALPSDTTIALPVSVLYQLFAFSFILFILLWRWKKPRLLFAALSFASLLIIAYAVWLAPLEGIVLNPTPLYQTPTSTAPLVISDPIPAGYKLEILAAEKDGQWLKVRDKHGNLGYIFYTTLRAI